MITSEARNVKYQKNKRSNNTRNEECNDIKTGSVGENEGKTEILNKCEANK